MTPNPANLNSISIVLPVYNCAGFIEPLYERLSRVLKATGLAYEIVFVEDCGQDDAWERLLELASRDRQVRAFKHSRNFGQHAAIATGLSQSRADVTIVMDADLQDPPESIPEFLDAARKGDEIVLSVRAHRDESAFRRICSQIVRRGFPLYKRLPNGRQFGSLSLVSARAVDRYLQEPDRCNFYIKILDRIPLPTGYVQYNQLAREGPSSYSLMRLVKLFCALVSPQYLWTVLALGSIGALASSGLLATFRLLLAGGMSGWLSGWLLPFLLVLDVVAIAAMICSASFLCVQKTGKRKLAASAVTIGAISEGALCDRLMETTVNRLR